MRAISYRRVSSSEQVESGAGLDAQIDAITRWADRAGAEIVADHVDEAVSRSTSLDRRPGLLLAIGDLRPGDVLVVAKRDRFGGDPIVGAMIEAAVERQGARIVSTQGEGTEGDAPTDILMRRIIDAFAEYERLIIRARTSAALQARKARGEIYRGVGKAPIGERIAADGISTERNDDEARAVELAVQLRSEGRTFRAIASALEATELKPRGKRWHPTTVQRMVARASA
jgi:DNA invertase Pin-like site-specific DNA recombinase